MASKWALSFGMKYKRCVLAVEEIVEMVHVAHQDIKNNMNRNMNRTHKETWNM